ncbi:hypothetical protein KIPB_008617 [Kipferlia bialata]|uniref:Uncharacterized protein n=1 Tax=Kipferlia bialata TaxID=797122 RepID=A0A9K3GLL4_9EUKA|nr:hypothetical protein KIPB_008617 [Kipferlia bialata]|eukprot:g8617.t1
MVGWAVYACMVDTDVPLSLPDDLYSSMSPDQAPYLRQRSVQSIAFGSLQSEPSKYLKTAATSRDALYVIEAISGHDWGATCFPSDPLFLDMDFTDKIRVIWGSSCNDDSLMDDLDVWSVLGVETPTKPSDLRAAGSLVFETHGCTRMGGSECQDALDEETDDLASVLSYGCYKTADNNFHHLRSR